MEMMVLAIFFMREAGAIHQYAAPMPAQQCEDFLVYARRMGGEFELNVPDHELVGRVAAMRCLLPDGKLVGPNGENGPPLIKEESDG